MSAPLIGTAGWTIPRAVADRFPDGASQLARYAQRLPAVEINSSFYKPHQPKTYARWAATVPETFRFSVKLPKAITHDRRLAGGTDLLDRFLGEIAGLGEKLGPVLVQLPPSLVFNPAVVAAFLDDMRQRFAGQVACEPRHASWFTDAADALLIASQIARVAADPAVDARAAVPGGWRGLTYRRLHGSPRVYYSDYAPQDLDAMARALVAPGAPQVRWCIFDNTALGCATANALTVDGRVAELMRSTRRDEATPTA